MALRFIDSCGDNYSTAQIPLKWDANSTGAVSAGAGRRGGNALNISFVRSYTKVLDAQSTWIIGCNLTLTAFPATPVIFIVLGDGATEQLSLRIDSSGHLVVSRNGTTLGTSTLALASGGVDNYIEFKAFINDTTGTYEAKVNGVSFVSGTGADTKNTANSTADRVIFGVNVSMGTNNLDDVYVCDGTGSVNNDFLGDCRVDVKYPDGAGNSTDLTPSTGSNFQCVDETTPNGDTDYVEHATVNNKDTYTFGNLSHNPSAIYGVQVNMYAKKDDAGVKNLCSVARSAGTDYDGSTRTLSTAYQFLREMIEADPATSAAWTQTNLNAAEFGVKVK